MLVLLITVSVMTFNIVVLYGVITSIKVKHFEYRAIKLRLKALGYEGIKKGQLRTKADEYEEMAKAWRNA